MDDHTVSTFLGNSDVLIEQLNEVLTGEGTDITEDTFAQIESKVSKLKHMLKSMESKNKIVDMINDDNSYGDISKKSAYYEQDRDYRRYCYECKTKIRSDKYRHVKYKSMCVLCGNINMFKRNTKSDQSGKIAIVTGGRIKIGYETALSLLKNGATVVVTSRFVDDCLERYSKEVSFDSFKDRLHIYQLNMLDEPNIKKFITYIKENFEHVDYLINNAAQTIRRPKQFYQHVIDKYLTYEDEEQIVHRDSDEILYVLNGDEGRQLFIENNDIPTITDVDDCDDTEDNTQLTKDEVLKKLFPVNKFDEFGQQIDLRTVNSWMLELDHVELKEFVEVMVINAIGPFILCQELKDLMAHSEESSEYSWIINVTSMEGIFNWKYKPTRHPHTNMAKAALNMMTRTCGPYYLENCRIVMVGVDTGWNNSQQPDTYARTTPVDCKDGSARILDPIYRKLTQHSVIYKDFKIIDY
jgi:NAD(P)-dependent dehydrogenase (short-subunit alcohol dehydrogenase family)